MFQSIGKMIVPLLIVFALLASAAVAFWRSAPQSLYTGPVDDSFLSYFSAGSRYTTQEFLVHVEKTSGGEIRLKREDLERWLEIAVAKGLLICEQGKKRTKKGRFPATYFSLSC
jgi:hypothetical protein